jgi:tRNA(adenine34) deaminase
MSEAIREANKALEMGEVPVGAVVVREDQVLGRGHNMVESLGDATAHAEIIAIGAASQTAGTWRLDDATIYTTLEPCLMCAGAIDTSRLERLVYAVGDSRKGAFGSVINILEIDGLCNGLSIDYGLMVDESSALLELFFKARRLDKKR